jgi:hypothetical protein
MPCEHIRDSSLGLIRKTHKFFSLIIFPAMFFYKKLPSRNLKLETRFLLLSAVEFHRSLCPQDMWVYMKLRRNVTIGGVSMFVVAGAISRSGRAGYMKFPLKVIVSGVSILFHAAHNIL